MRREGAIDTRQRGRKNGSEGLSRVTEQCVSTVNSEFTHILSFHSPQPRDDRGVLLPLSQMGKLRCRELQVSLPTRRKAEF